MYEMYKVYETFSTENHYESQLCSWVYTIKVTTTFLIPISFVAQNSLDVKSKISVQIT